MKRCVILFLMAWLLAGSVFAPSRGQTPGASPEEPSAPGPSEAIRRLLEEAARSPASVTDQERLQAVDRARAAARAGGDAAGEAHADRMRAILLERLGRAKEAAVAWRETAEAWERAGDGPGRVEALAQAALHLAPVKPAEATTLWRMAITAGRTEKKRPLAAAQALDAAIFPAVSRRYVAQARALGEAALAIRERLVPHSLALAATLNKLGAVAQEQGERVSSRQYLLRALELFEQLSPGSVGEARALNNLGALARQPGELESAKRYLERALAIFEKAAPDSFDAAASLSNLGDLARQQGELEKAGTYLRRALAIKEARVPGSLSVAGTLINLGQLVQEQGDLESARAFQLRALALQEKLAPNSLDVAESLNNLGNLARGQGDLDGAKAYYQRALAIREKLVPNSLPVAGSLNNLGVVAYEQGNLESAGEYHRRVLAIVEKQAPGSLDLAGTLANLGNVSRDQGELGAAQEYYDRALAIHERLAPGSGEVAGNLNNLGGVAYEQGDLAAAERYYRRALAIKEKLGPNSLEVASTLNNLGNLNAVRVQGDLQVAEEYYRRALAIEEKLAPNSLNVATSLSSLGWLARRRGNREASLEFLRRALALKEKLAPNSLSVGEILFELALAAQEQGDWREAERLLNRAWSLVLRQATAVTGEESRLAFGSRYMWIAASLVRAQVALGQLAAAFTTLEEGRAHALQQLLTERRAVLGAASGTLWPAHQRVLADLYRAQQRVQAAGAALSVAQGRLASLQSSTAAPQTIQQASADVEKAARRFEEAQTASLRARQQEVQLWGELKRRAPRAFAKPLSLRQAPRVLPPGVLYVAFSVDDGETQLFLVRGGAAHAASVEPAPLSVHRVQTTAKELLALVRRLRSRVTSPEVPVSASAAAGRALFAALFPPKARQEVLRARRLLIAPDGPLWEVPFAALVTNAQGPPRYLGAEKPITYTQSLTLFAQSRQDRPRLPQSGRVSALVVGDPVFTHPATRIASAALGSRTARRERAFLTDSGEPPPRLPWTAKEAGQVGRLYGVIPLTRERATEAALRQRMGKADVIHLATHAYLHPVLRMSSRVLLAAPREAEMGRTANDGALQAWEIFSQLRLKAELVVLSACETGRGHTVQGEGIVGLTRALQYAGARSIVASQWRVADESTRLLMTAFHQRLRQGKAKDEALREAMAVVRQRAATAHPYHWAPFVLTGDPENPLLGGSGGPASSPKRLRRG